MEHLTYKKLGDFFGTTDMAVHKWLNAKGLPTMARLPEIAHKLNVSVEYLLPNQPLKNTEYSDDEVKLLNCYRQLSKTQQQILCSIADQFSEQLK